MPVAIRVHVRAVRRHWRSLVLALPSTLVAVWAWLLFAGRLPFEDDFGWDRALVYALLAGAAVGLYGVGARARRWRRVAIIAAASSLFIVAAAGDPRIALVNAVLATPLACIAAWLGRIAGRTLPRWRRAILAGLLPLIAACVLAFPVIDQWKALSPWMLHRREILDFEANASAAARRLHLPDDRALTPAERETWAEAAPLQMTFTVPSAPPVTVHAVDPYSQRSIAPHGVWADWDVLNHHEFGPLDPRWMFLLWADD